MKIDIFSAHRTLRAFERAWIDEYVPRCRPYADLRLCRVKEEWKDVKKLVGPGSYKILLDPLGKSMDTVTFAKLFDRSSSLAFLVGGSHGFPPHVPRECDVTVSLTPLTLPHRLALLVLSEQIYRVLSWRAGSPYHHA